MLESSESADVRLCCNAEIPVGCCRADADLRLLSKRQPGKKAFKDKVVWITGASQVRRPALLLSLMISKACRVYL